MINNTEIYFDRLAELSNKKKIPLIGEFEITSRCNLNCVMCYTRKSPSNQDAIKKELTKDEIIKIACEARDAGMLHVLLTGGEVFLREDFKEIYYALKDLGLLITIYTNGTLINDSIVEWLVKNPPYLISITLYGASRDTYKRVTGKSNGFDLAINAIDLLISNNINVELKTTWVKGNIDDFSKIKEISEARNLKIGVVNYVFPALNAECSDPIGNRLDPKILAKEFKSFIDYFNDKYTCTKNELFKVVDMNDAFDCSAGKSFFNVSSEGYLSSCSLISEFIYDLRKNDFLESYNNLIKDYRTIKRFDDCDNCLYRNECFPCPARRFVESNNYYVKPNYLCEYAKELTFLKSNI